MQALISRGRWFAPFVALVAVSLVVLAACAASAGSPTAPTPTTATPAATPVASPSASSATGDRTYVGGTTDCNAVKETPIEGVERPVRLTFDCTYEMSDPRVSGPAPMDCDEGFYDLADLPGGVGIWDTCSGVLTGQGGTWKMVVAYGSEFMKSDVLRISGTQIFEGQGAFAGLRFVMHFSESPELTRLDEVAGWIEPME